MSELRLGGSSATALTHLALFGLASILEDGGEPGVRVSWTTEMDPRPVLHTYHADLAEVAAVVRHHAMVHSAPDSWVSRRRAGPEGYGLMSPRVAAPADAAAWRTFYAERGLAIDQAEGARQALDLRFIGALGAPSYWHSSGSFKQGRPDPRPDFGASRWEMTPRNRGTEFVVNRLIPLASNVAAREAVSIVEGLAGQLALEGSRPSGGQSRMANGLAAPGPTDDAVAWCALWGISMFALFPKVTAPSRAAGHHPSLRDAAGLSGQAWFYLPVPSTPIGMPALRTIIVSRSLERVAGWAPDNGGSGGPSPLEVTVARRWLRSRGVGGVARFLIRVGGSASAPEYRALDATIVATDDAVDATLF